MKTLYRFLSIAAPFWLKRYSWPYWLLLASVIGCSLAIVQVSVWITEWNKDFYDALAQFDAQLMPKLITIFLGYIVLITASIACGNWLRKKLLFVWREHLTHELEQEWLSQHRHYRLQLMGNIDNPDQRIAEDVAMLTEKSIDLFKYFIMNVAKLGAFVAILWNMSGVQNIVVLGHMIAVKGYLVWIALLYSLICTLVMHIIGHKLQGLNVERQHREADYRTGLLRVRDNTEQIALYNGETAELSRLKNYFGTIKGNWQNLIRKEFYLEIFSAAYLRVSMFIPIIATLPMYLAHSMTFGDMMQARSAFSNVQDGFGWFMDYYKRIIEWAAVVERLSGFQTALRKIDSDMALSMNKASASLNNIMNHQDGKMLVIEQLTVYTHSRILFNSLSFQGQASEWILLEGKSGIGKSTLLRTLAGLWPNYQGNFALYGSSLFLPQRPYLAFDCLRAVISYPYQSEKNDIKIYEVLEKVGLGRLSNDLDKIQEWQQILSGGEQQRLSLARALLNPPQILFLDEATNQLDDDSALLLMAGLKEMLPDSLCIIVSHQVKVQMLVNRKITLTAEE